MIVTWILFIIFYAIMDNKVHNCEVTTDDFQKHVEEIAVDSKKIESFSNSCVELYKNIVQNNTYTNILPQLVNFNKEFPDRKNYLFLFVNDFNLSFCCYMILVKMIQLVSLRLQ